MAGKNTASGIRKMQKIPDKNRDDGEKNTAGACTKQAEKTLRKSPNTGMAEKNTASSIRKMWKISDENRDDGEKHGRSLYKTGRKECSGNPKMPE